MIPAPGLSIAESPVPDFATLASGFAESLMVMFRGEFEASYEGSGTRRESGFRPSGKRMRSPFSLGFRPRGWHSRGPGGRRSATSLR